MTCPNLFIIIKAEISDLLHREYSVRVALIDDPVSHALLVDLSIIDLLLEATVHYETVHEAGLPLPVSRSNTIL